MDVALLCLLVSYTRRDRSHQRTAEPKIHQESRTRPLKVHFVQVGAETVQDFENEIRVDPPFFLLRHPYRLLLYRSYRLYQSFALSFSRYIIA